jgi:hypothetical protein
MMIRTYSALTTSALSRTCTTRHNKHLIAAASNSNNDMLPV